MTKREKISAILSRESTGDCGFWTGNPHPDTQKLYLKQAGLSNLEELYLELDDDCRAIAADAAYLHPEGKPCFDVNWGGEVKTLGGAGFFENCEDVREVENFPWPDPKYIEPSAVLTQIDAQRDRAVFTGLWCPFFHNVADLFGMENYFVKMYTDPDVVDAVTERVVGFYLAANEIFYQAAGDSFDTFFFGNDFGTQLDLFISPELFRRFVLPHFKRLIDQAKKYGKKVLLHSCGSVSRVIPLLIEAGIDGLHPLQAKAAHMDAETLAREFRNDLAFVGGVDTQELLIRATPAQVREEVLRLRDLLGPNLIISPSHEAILPNIPLDNIVAMARAARE